MPLTLTVLRCPDNVPPETRTIAGGAFTVGRGPGVDWVLPDPERLLSKHHFAVAYRGGAWQIADTSTNGTTLNRDAEPIGRNTVRTLRDGDRLNLGAYEIEVRLTDDPPPQPAFGSGAGRPAAVRDANPFDDPFALDPLAPPPPPRRPFGEAPDPFAFSPGGPQLPPDFDPLAPDPNPAPFLGPTQEDHRPVLEDAFRPPAIGPGQVAPGGKLPADALLPDNWEKDLLSGITPPAGRVLPPAPPATPSPPPVAYRPPQPSPAAAPAGNRFAEPEPPASARPAVANVPRPAPTPFDEPFDLEPPAQQPPPFQSSAAPPPAAHPAAVAAHLAAAAAPPTAAAAHPGAVAYPSAASGAHPAAPLYPSAGSSAPSAAPSYPPAAGAHPAAAAFASPPAASPSGPSAAPSAAESALLAAFLQGAKMEDVIPADPAATMRRLGAAFRALVTGLRAVLIARASIKSEFRIEQTMIRARGNNPLKFAAGDDDALAALLGAGRRTDMTAAEAVADALKDIRLHELASMTAMQAAVRGMLDNLDPARLRARAEQGGLSVLPAQRKARAWDVYEALFSQTMQALTDDFDSVFGKAFARAYERALDEITTGDK